MLAAYLWQCSHHACPLVLLLLCVAVGEGRRSEQRTNGRLRLVVFRTRGRVDALFDLQRRKAAIYSCGDMAAVFHGQ